MPYIAFGLSTTGKVLAGLGVCLLAAVIVLFNLITLTVLALRRALLLKLYSDYFIVNLAVADLAVGLFSIPAYVPYFLTGRWDAGRDLCYFWLLYDCVACYSSVFSVCFISLDRYLLVAHWIWYMKHKSRRLLHVLMMAPWLLPALFLGPPMLLWEEMTGEQTIGQGDCHEPFLFSSTFIYLTMPLFFFTPLVAMSTLNFLVYLNIRKREKRKRMSVTLSAFETAHASHAFLRMRLRGAVSSAGHCSRSQGSPLTDEETLDSKMEIRDVISADENCRVPWRKPASETAQIVASDSSWEEDERGGNSDQPLSGALEPFAEGGKPSGPQRGTADGTDKETDGDIVPCEDRQTSDIGAASPRKTRAAGGTGGQTETSVRFRETESLPHPRASPMPDSFDMALGRSESTNQLRRDKAAWRFLAILVLVFLLCWLPYWINRIVLLFCPECNYIVFNTISFWLVWVNSAINPVIYVLLNSRFRKGFRSVFTCCK